jgi:hypothetical protein
MIRSSNVLAAQLVSVILAQASEVMASRSVLWVLWYSGVEALAASKSRGSNGFPAAWHA